jgi:NAD(P)-dependent dehydrogenase (short-subunit alcohol dehydrogenase family)
MIFLVDIAEKGLKETEALIKELSPNANIAMHTADVSHETSVKGMVDECVKRFGRLDFACNNAGVAMSNLLTTETDVNTFDKLHKVNNKGVRVTPLSH